MSTGLGGRDDETRFFLPPGRRVNIKADGREITDRYTYDDVLAAEAAAPLDAPYMYFDQDDKRRNKPGRPEESIADWLQERAVLVRSVDHAQARLPWPKPDAICDTVRCTVEFKTMEEFSVAGLDSDIREAGKQAPYVVIDARSVEARPADAEEGLRRGVRWRGNALKQVIVVLAFGEHLEWRP